MTIRTSPDPLNFSTHIVYEETMHMVQSAILGEIVDGIASKFIQEHTDRIIASLDTTAITKMVAERVAVRLVEKMIGTLANKETK